MVLFFKHFKRKVKEPFIKDKEALLEKLHILLFNLQQCVSAGMIDQDDTIYNEIESIIDDTHGSDDYRELRELLSQAKTIETNIDNWLISQGNNMIGINWPNL